MGRKIWPRHFWIDWSPINPKQQWNQFGLIQYKPIIKLNQKYNVAESQSKKICAEVIKTTTRRNVIRKIPKSVKYLWLDRLWNLRLSQMLIIKQHEPASVCNNCVNLIILFNTARQFLNGWHRYRQLLASWRVWQSQLFTFSSKITLFKEKKISATLPTSHN